MKDQDDDNGKQHFLFRGTGKHRAVVNEVEVIQNVLKHEGLQETWNPNFTDLYSSMFHLAKRKTTETTWKYLLCQNVAATTNVENIDTTVVTDWRGFMVLCSYEAAGDCQPS